MLVSGPVGADAEDSRYRVEILVLTHIGHDEPPRETAALEDFSDALDFLTPPADSATAAEAGEDSSAEPVCTVVHRTDMGPEMQEAWRRLRLSGPFRPLQYLAWEQPGIPPFPALRVHDLESVLTEDPWLTLREARGEEILASEAGAGFADAGSGPLPAPIQYFRLDGRMRLVRTRFLHLEVLAELREPVFDPSLAQPQPMTSSTPVDPQDVEPQPTSFLVYRLDQRRQVKTGRMEYFDGPVLGVLAFITDISDTIEEEPSTSP